MKSVSSIDDDYDDNLRSLLKKAVLNFFFFFNICRKATMLESFLIKLKTYKFIEKRLQRWCFLLHVRKFLRTAILKNISEWLLLNILLLQEFIFLFTIIKKNNDLYFGEENSSLKWDYVIELNCNQTCHYFDKMLFFPYLNPTSYLKRFWYWMCATRILMSWFKEKTERRKTSFLEETVESADLHKAVLKKLITTQE